MKNWFFLLLALPLMVFSCRKDIDSTTVTNSTYQPPVVIVTATLTGQILGPDGGGVDGAVVRVGNKATVSDENGFYQFRGIEMNARGTYVTANKEGYFLGSDRLYPLPGSKNISRIELLPKTIAGTFSGAEGGVIEVENARVTFPEGGVVDATGSLYTGQVSVAAQWLNPVANNIQDIMPGGLFGLNADSREVMMASLGMLAVELYDESGNLLQVAPGREAELRVPVPNELLANAPAEVPLWYFDETDGVWIEDGLATLQDGVYVGEVSHFTFWNVDVPSGVELIFISGCVVTSDGEPVAHTRLRIIAPSNIYTYAYGDTDESGHFSGYLPAGDLLTFELFDECGTMYSFEVGPFSEDTNINECFEIPSSSIVTLSGQIVDCDGAGVEDAIVSLGIGGFQEITIADADGNFTYTVPNCGSNEVSVIAYDIDGGNTTEEVTVTVDDDIDLGQLSACDNPIAEFIDASTNGVDLFFIDVSIRQDSVWIDSLSIEPAYQLTGFAWDEDLNEGHNIWLNMLDIAPGTYSGDDIEFNYNVESNAEGFFLQCPRACNTIEVTITANGGPGGFLEGSYEGTSDGWTFQQMPLTDAPVSGTFRVQLPQ